MADHDRLCTEHDSHWEPDECPECQAIARVRADEREQRDSWSELAAKTRAATLADLRAKVETMGTFWIDGGVRRLDVLALIDEAQQ